MQHLQLRQFLFIIYFLKQLPLVNQALLQMMRTMIQNFNRHIFTMIGQHQHLVHQLTMEQLLQNLRQRMIQIIQRHHSSEIGQHYLIQ